MPHQGRYIVANKYMKKSFTSHVIKEMQIKIIRYHYESIRTAKIQDTDNTKCWEDTEQQELPFIAGGSAKWYSPFGRRFGNHKFFSFQKNITTTTYSYHTIQQLHSLVFTQRS